MLMVSGCGGTPPAPAGPPTAGLAKSAAAPADAGSLDVSDKTLARFTTEHRELLLRHLASSARWRVSAEEGQLMAVRREADPGATTFHDLPPEALRTTLNGFYVTHAQYLQSRVRVRFGVQNQGDYWDLPEHFQLVPVGSGIVKLRGAQAINEGWKTNVRLDGGSGIYLEIMEESSDPKRAFSQRTLRELNRELAQVLARRKELETMGYLAELVPRESTRPGRSTLAVEGDGGTNQVVGYVNPGEPGHTRLRVFNNQTGAPLSADRVDQRSREYPGWSVDGARQFFINSQVTIYEGDFNTRHPARFEVWFTPTKGGPERKLVETIATVTGWER
ncbi:MAG: hypothetical protein ACO1SX_21330 [Actinomycetota bacterium]